MFTKSNILDIAAEKPFCADISKKNMCICINGEEGGFEWTPEHYLILDLEFHATSRTFIYFNFFSKGEKLITLNYSIIPNRRIKTAVKLDELASKKWFLTPHPGNLKGHVMGKVTHISKIDKVSIENTYCRDGKDITVYNAYLSKELPDFTIIGEPMVDMFGQNKDVIWEDKIKSEKELEDYLKGEYEKAESAKGYSNPDWNEYGGYKKLKFDKTGYFHTHFDSETNRWWLVDPDGCAFLSNGVCYGTRMGVHGFVDGMENLFDWLPDYDDPVFKQAWTTADNIPEFVKRNGKEAGKKRKMFNFARANMIRVFKDKWWDAWVKINSARLKSWGFNTISVCVNNYFDENVYEYLKKAKIPYTWTLKKFPKTKNMIFRDFPDVFSPEYETLCAEFAKQLEPIADDKYMIGYFINNEPEWLVEREVNIAEQLLLSSEQLYSKREFVKFAEKKYNTVEKFNEAWNINLKSFDELLSPMSEDSIKSEAAKADLNEFKDILVSQYNKIPAEAVKVYAPNNMCLGMRYARVAEGDFAGSDFYDTFSFNCYKKDPSEYLKIANEGTKTPFMIGEWHYGASDTSMLCSALVTCPTQEERGWACYNYIQTAYANPQLVGAHYFEYNDQPLLGRFDGEAMPHGLIDICNRPHKKCLDIFTKANNKIYGYALGTEKPIDIKCEFTKSF